jgi:hypothetical protein
MPSTLAGADAPPSRVDNPQVRAGWQALDCSLPGVRPVFDACAHEAVARLGVHAVQAYWDGGRQLGKLGRGVAPVLAWLTYWPAVIEAIGEAHAADGKDAVWAVLLRMHKSPNSAAIAPLLTALSPVAQRVQGLPLLQQFLDTVVSFMDRTTGSIHGRQASLPSPGLVPLLQHAPALLQTLPFSGWQAWVDFGAHAYAHHPPQQMDYFALRSPDSLAVLQRERHGTLLCTVERTLGLSLQALWGLSFHLVPLTTASASLESGLQNLRAVPCWQNDVMGLPDVLDDQHGVSALDRYRLMLMHLAAHQQLSTTCVADNWSPAQRMAVEWFEDTRVDLHLMQTWPGLRGSMLALYPQVVEGGCNEATHACQLHRLSVLGRAVLDPEFALADPQLREWRQRLFDLASHPGTTTAQVADLALQFVARTRRASDARAQVHFDGTVVDWRDDNRHLWRFIEDGDEEDSAPSPTRAAADELQSLPPQLYPEWDYLAGSERPDWVRVFETLHPAGDAGHIDRLLQRHAGLSKRLQRMLDQLKPQGRTRQRHLENGSELDLDVALTAHIDLQSGHTPSHRVEQHVRPVERDVSVQLVMDLSASLNDVVPGANQTVLQISQEAVALLAWALHQLGDALAIGGFYSNTRLDVRYMHIKGFAESWGEAPKARLAALEPAYSTRMGAALRHAGRTLKSRTSDKKLMLVLTDGEPSDVDVSDARYLVEDARKAVQSLEAQGMLVWCIHLHSQHDATVKAIYGQRYVVIDRLQSLPERLTSLFLSLTR